MDAPAHNTTETARTTLYAMATRSLCVAMAAAALSLPSAQAAEFYMKIDGIEGSVQQKDHKKWINIDSVLQFSPDPMESGRRGALLGEVTANIITDKALPKLLEAAATGQVIDKLEVHGTTTSSGDDKTRVPYFQWELKNVQVTSYQSDPGGGGETVTVGGFTAGNLVEYVDNGAGQPRGRVVESFRVDPLTGAPDYDFVDPAIPMKGGVHVQPVGTPNYLDEDDDGDGVADRVVLSGLGTTGLDGYEVSGPVKETTHNIEFLRGDPNNDAHVIVSTAYGKDGKKGGNVETTWKVEEGEKLTRPRRKLELKADYSDLGASLYEYTVAYRESEFSESIVAQGVASVDDVLVLAGDECDDDCDGIPPSESLSINYEKIKWTYEGLDRGVLPDGQEIELDPALATSVSLRPIGGEPVGGLPTTARLTFANFERVSVLGVAAVPEPGALGLTAIAAGFATAVRRRREGQAAV